MKQKANPTVISDIILNNAEYFRINKAAEILGCTTEDLLHMGVIGKAEILAPVVSVGIFEWPRGMNGLPFDEIDTPVQREFDATDRVILSKKDLAKIEAIGWTIPSFFFSPSKAREVVKYAQTWMGLDIVEDSRVISTTKDEFGNITGETIVLHQKPWEPDSESLPFREMGFYTPWYAVKQLKKNADRTTIAHLFISHKELERIKENKPQDNATVQHEPQEHKPAHGNVEWNAKRRESVLQAAIYCKIHYPEECSNNRLWAEKIETSAMRFWPEGGGELPLSTDMIERLLGQSQDEEKQRMENTKTFGQQFWTNKNKK
jgi:hypothetical protein